MSSVCIRMMKRNCNLLTNITAYSGMLQNVYKIGILYTNVTLLRHIHQPVTTKPFTSAAEKIQKESLGLIFFAKKLA